jgi:hypothetical protein
MCANNPPLRLLLCSGRQNPMWSQKVCVQSRLASSLSKKPKLGSKNSSGGRRTYWNMGIDVTVRPAPTTDPLKSMCRVLIVQRPSNSRDQPKGKKAIFESDYRGMKTQIVSYYYPHPRFIRTILTQPRIETPSIFQFLSHSAIHTNTNTKTPAFSPSVTDHNTARLLYIIPHHFFSVGLFTRPLKNPLNPSGFFMSAQLSRRCVCSSPLRLASRLPKMPP